MSFGWCSGRERRAGFIALMVMVWGSLEVARSEDWPQWLGPKRDGHWRETGIVETFPAGGPPRVWQVPIGAGYSGPAVVGNRLYVMDRSVDEGSPKPKSPFDASTIPGKERVLCLDASNGGTVWTRDYVSPYTVSYAAGPRTTPLVSGGRVYTLGTMGHLACQEASNGRLIWSRDFVADFGLKVPTWGVSAHPLLDGNRLICVVGGEGSVAVAFDKDTGKELWRSLSAKEPGYCPPVIAEVGGRRQLILWHAEAVNGLDPETGRVLWTEPWKLNYGMAIATPRVLPDGLFLTCFYNGSMRLRFEPGRETPVVAWKTAKQSERDTVNLNCTMATPWVEGDYVYGPCSYGQFRCMKLGNGERLWETFAPTAGKSERWGNCFVVKNGERWFLMSETGDLIIARLSPAGYTEISRAHVIDPINRDPGRPVVWSHPAFANRRIYLRNDREIACYDLSAR
ncbi:MAG: PQQ-like beta-propeller repeat protein [Verrucomicrobiales bacterium]|nr:PQQ-like beta-propeller repeat protein [Verrucomicrobiales bacterium]